MIWLGVELEGIVLERTVAHSIINGIVLERSVTDLLTERLAEPVRENTLMNFIVVGRGVVDAMMPVVCLQIQTLQ